MRRVLIAVGLACVAAAALVVYLTLNDDSPAAPALPELGRADPRSSQAGALTDSLSRFGFALLAKEAATTGDNVVISPASVHAVLSMLLSGAEGATASEIEQALALDGLTGAELGQAWADLITTAQVGDGSKVGIADSLWLRDGVPFEPAFIAANRDYFAADLRELPDDPAEAAAQINAWIEQRTAGRIEELVTPGDFSEATILTLVNTVYLKVRWEHFDPAATQPEPFHLADGRTAEAPMMRSHLEAGYSSTDAYDAVALETDGPVTVWVVVPRDRHTPEDVASALADGGYRSLLESARQVEGSIVLPRLSLEYESDHLKEHLQALGITRAFSPDEAEFGGVAELAGNVYVEAILHKANLDMDEEGVEAAAATGAIVGVTSAPAETFSVRADRPFLVVLAEESSGAPLFTALVRDPR
jgi:serine protease inhibitor